MNMKVINSKKDYKLALKRVNTLWSASSKTPEYDEMVALSSLIYSYEETHFPIEAPDSIEAIKFRADQMEQKTR